MVGNTNLSRESGEPYPASHFANAHSSAGQGTSPVSQNNFLWVFPTTLATIREVPLLPRLLQVGLKSHGLLLVNGIDGAVVTVAVYTNFTPTTPFP